MEKGLMKVLKDGAYVGVHPETESSQVTDFATAVKATKVDNAIASDTATKATQDSNGNNIATFYAPVSGNAGSHNALFRGKDLTS